MRKAQCLVFSFVFSPQFSLGKRRGKLNRRGGALIGRYGNQKSSNNFVTFRSQDYPLRNQNKITQNQTIKTCIHIIRIIQDITPTLKKRKQRQMCSETHSCSTTETNDTYIGAETPSQDFISARHNSKGSLPLVSDES